MAKGIEVSVLSNEVGNKLQGFYDGKQFPFVRRNDNGTFSVCVHSRPFGNEKLTPAEIKARDEKKARIKAEKKAKRDAKSKANAEKKAREAKERQARAEARHQEAVKKAEERLKALKSA